MKKLILAAFFALCTVGFAGAQSGAVRQSGTVTPGHAAMWTTSGVIQDAGTAANGFLTSLGVTNNGGPGICINSAPITGPYNRLCMAVSTAAAAQISLQNLGGAAAQSLQFNINGTVSSIVTATGSFTANNVACFQSSSGILIDCGMTVVGGVVTSGTWNGTPIPIAFGGTGATSSATARSNLGLGTMAVQSSSSVAITGGTITGMPSPTNPSDVAIKSYVDSTSAGLHILSPSRLATAAVLPNTPTYSNGASGVGATLTSTGNTTITVDGIVAALNDIVLVKNQAAPAQNGIYYVSTAGSGAAQWVLTRCSAAACSTQFNNAATMLAGSYTFITAGDTNANTAWVLSATVASVGTDAVSFYIFSNANTGVTSLNGKVGAIVLPYLFAADYGVITDGTDVTTQLQNAITACGAPRAVNPTFTGSTTLYLPVGNIQITDEITSTNACIVVGMGSGTPLFPASGNIGGTQITQATSGKGIFTFTTLNSVQVRDLSMVLTVGASAGSAIKIVVPNTADDTQINYNSRVSNVTIHGGYIGIYCHVCWSFVASGNYIDGFAYTGILLESAAVNTDAGIVTLHANTIIGRTTSDSCVLMIPQSNVTIDGSHKCNSSLNGYHLITNGSGTGKGVASGTFQVFGGSMENQENYSILVQQLVSGTVYGQIIVSGVQFLTLAASTAYQNSISIKAGTGPLLNNNYISKVLINNNLIIQQGGSNGYSVIDVASTEEVQINNNRIDCNSLPNCDGIKIDANSRDVSLIENRIKNITRLYRISALNAFQTLLMDRNGITVADLNAQLAGANAFPTFGSQMFVTNGTAATAPVVAGGLGCYAFYRNGVWACP